MMNSNQSRHLSSPDLAVRLTRKTQITLERQYFAVASGKRMRDHRRDS